MNQPRRIWWARPKKLCALERPGGGGRSHRPERREADLAYLKASGVRLIVSTMSTRHNLAEYDRAGIDWHHVPVTSCEEGAEALDEILLLLRRELRTKGAVAIHGNRHTDFVSAVCAAHMHEARGIPPVKSIAAAASSGMVITPAACTLVGVEHPSWTAA